MLARQLRGNLDTTNVEPWGSSVDGDDFQVRMRATDPMGRGRVKLQIEACPAGENWGGAGSVTVESATWTDVTASAAGVTLTETVSGLGAATLYRWRARVLYAPYTHMVAPLSPAHGPWRRVHGQAVEADIRTTDNSCVLTCAADISTVAAEGQCSAAVVYSPPSSSGGCGAVTCSPASGSAFPVGVTVVTCSDGSAICSFNVTVSDTQPPSVTCPADITATAAAGQCSAVVAYTTPAASDNCAGATVACSPASGSTFSLGTTTVTCTATDAVGLTGTCTFAVTVEDAEPPSITCPADLTAGADPGQCSAVVTFADPTAADACSGTTVSCAPASGSSFPVGSTTVTCMATDTSGNASTCTFTVTVADTQPPAIICPADITTPTAAGQCSAAVAFAATATDNCAGVAVACVPASGSTFPIGSTAVACTATDASGNSVACTFTVTVFDAQAPTIVCPPNQTTTGSTADPGTCQISATVSYPAPTVTDNCPGATAACVPASGSVFPVGSTTVVCTATDAAGNSSSCSFTVTVTAGLGPCYRDDVTGDTFQINTTVGSPLFRYWQYRMANGTVFCGFAESLNLTPGRSLSAQDRDDPETPMTCYIDFGLGTARVTVVERAGNIQHVLKDRNIYNNAPCH